MDAEARNWTPVPSGKACALCGMPLDQDETHVHDRCAAEENHRSQSDGAAILGLPPAAKVSDGRPPIIPIRLGDMVA